MAKGTKMRSNVTGSQTGNHPGDIKQTDTKSEVLGVFCPQQSLTQ